MPNDNYIGASPPAIILVEPQMGENIGAAARAMANFGLTDLASSSRATAGRARRPGPRRAARPASSTRCRVFDTAEAAVADLNFVFATTARARDLPKPVVGPREAAAELQDARPAGEACGVLFGRERWGLTNEEVALADAIVTFPVNPKFASLNIAQAVLLVPMNGWPRALTARCRRASACRISRRRRRRRRTSSA